MNVAVEKTKSFELKKHVAAIHSSNPLTLIQRKIANALLHHAYDYLLEKEVHQIHIKTLCDLIGYDSKDFKKIKDTLMALISTVIQWNLVDKNSTDDEGVWNASTIIAGASIDGPICSYSYSPWMRQLLYRPEMYGRLNMQIQSRFKSTYGLALYENCIRFQDIPQTPWIDINTFRKLMGVAEGQYPIFRDFKRRVIDKAISEVNEHSPIFVSVKFKKVARQVFALQFLINHSKNLLLEDPTITKANRSLSERLSNDFSFSETQIKQALSSYEEQYVLEKISLIESSSSFLEGKIKNLAKYLESALENDFKAPKNSRDRVDEIRQEKAKNKQVEKQKEIKLEQYRAYQNEQILKLHRDLSCAKKLQLEKDFLLNIGEGIYHNVYLKEGLNNVLVANRFCDFVRNFKKDLLINLINFDDFCKADFSI